MKRVFLLVVTILLIQTMTIRAQESATFTYKVGNYEVILLSEGQNQGKAEVLIGATSEMLAETMPDGTYPTAANAFLVKTPDEIVLIDAGYGRRLLDNLKSVGVSPEQVDRIIITHLHSDHFGGLLKEGLPLFPSARIQLSGAEQFFWMSDSNMNKLPEDRRGGFNAARNLLKLYEKNIRLVAPGEIGKRKGEGIFFVKAYGHTPGHTACLIQSKGEQLLVWADVTHAMSIQMPYPEVAVKYDVEPDRAIETRKKILEYVVAHNISVAGMHIPYPGIGKVEKSTERGYLFVPAK